MSCANTGSSCAAGGWGTGPRRALMVSTRVGMDGLGTTGAGYGAIADSHLARDGTGRRTGRGAAAGHPWAGSQPLTKAGTKIGAPGLGHASLPRSSGRHFLPPRPSARSLSRRNPLPPPPSSTSKLRGRVPAPRLLTLDARLYFTLLQGGRASSPDWQLCGQWQGPMARD